MTFAIRTYGSLPHQRGRGGNGETLRTDSVKVESGIEHRDGPVVVLVKNFKPLNERGRELLRKPS